MAVHASLSADEERFESIIQNLIDHQLGQEDGFLNSDLVKQLRINLELYYSQNQMHEAGIGKNEQFDKNKLIRGDSIKWIDDAPENPAEQEFLEIVQNFVDYLNKTCYTGIDSFEFHYARYDVGSFYKRHRDQFRADSGRKFSLVFYLNEDWQESYGGQLVIYLPTQTDMVFPVGGRAVFFKADEIDHEVNVASHVRYSIAGWLKKG
ncbi:MAG TPA: 2OG-Fe(II) oxygenase [Saprospiraceae bacterium]|nr:2OG-Fe(II) oxygenase [Saprospiraceae bacterium]